MPQGSGGLAGCGGSEIRPGAKLQTTAYVKSGAQEKMMKEVLEKGLDRRSYKH